MKIGSLFDGIGGWPYAAEKAGGTALWASEIEPFPQEVTKVHFPKMQHLGDITKINGAEIEPVDVITLGSPCQDLSVAGKREGLDGARSGLFKTAINIVRQMRNATNGKYPRFIVWENVPGAFSSNKGADFRTVLEEITETEIPMPTSGRWATAGMVRSNKCEVAWRVLDAQFWGVPQRRKRIFLVADFGGKCATEILFKPESMSGDFAEGCGEGQRIAGITQNSPGKSSEPVTFSVGNLVRGADAEPNNNGVCKTLRADMGDQHPCICLNDQGGQSINVDYDVSPTLRSESHGNNPCVVSNPAIAWTLKASGAHAVCAPAASGGVDIYNQAFLPELAQTLRSAEGGDSTPTVLVQGPTYSMGHDERDSQFINNLANSLTASDYKAAPIVNQNHKVRRLTPTECERLQGLPDGYTLIDDKKCSDSARYKALGNGMAQPCPDFVMEGIARVLKTSPAWDSSYEGDDK